MTLREIVLGVEALEATGDFKVLRRLHFNDLGFREPMFDDVFALVVDTETTGLDPRRDKIVELAFRMVYADGNGEVIAVGDPRSWLEDPGFPLSPMIKTLTGLSDDVLAGKSFDDKAIEAAFAIADFIVAHNASFDRRFVERRFPAVSRKPWACTCTGIDWRGHGFDGRSLGWLLMQAGLFQPEGAHRAGADVDATVGLLRHKLPCGRTVFQEIYQIAQQPTWLFKAIGAPFEVKDALKARGCRWDCLEHVWWREVDLDQREGEEAWLRAEIYAAGQRARFSGPEIRQISWFDRHR